MSASAIAAARLQRSERRTTGMQDGAQLSARSAALANTSELQILKAEVADSGATISKLQTQLKESEAEMQEMGSRTARMQEELKQMRELAEQQLGPVPAALAADSPMVVSISLGDADGADISAVKVKLRPSLDSAR